MLRHRSLVMIFSDLLADPEPVREALLRLRHRGHDVILFHVLDPNEIEDVLDRHLAEHEDGLRKLLLYAERCPVEIGGLGTVLEDADGLLITDVFLLAQKSSAWDTELDAEAQRAIESQRAARVW